MNWVHGSRAAYICKQNKNDTYGFKSHRLRWVSLWLCGRIAGWRMSQLVFNSKFENLACLATLKSCDTTKQTVCVWLYIYDKNKWIAQTVTTGLLVIFCSLLAIGLMSSVFAIGAGDQSSILRWVILKTRKMVLDAALRSTQHYKVSIKDKVEESWEWSSAAPTPWCSSYWKGSLRVTNLLAEELHLTKYFFAFFYILALVLTESWKLGGTKCIGFHDMPEPLHPSFPFSSHVSLFLTKINPPQ